MMQGIRHLNSHVHGGRDGTCGDVESVLHAGGPFRIRERCTTTTRDLQVTDQQDAVDGNQKSGENSPVEVGIV